MTQQLPQNQFWYLYLYCFPYLCIFLWHKWHNICIWINIPTSKYREKLFVKTLIHNGIPHTKPYTCWSMIHHQQCLIRLIFFIDWVNMINWELIMIATHWTVNRRWSHCIWCTYMHTDGHTVPHRWSHCILCTLSRTVSHCILQCHTVSH